ncbi:hypothetical protein [Megasphaera elsdenii]|uniref:hypothetical protein n=1 Tax=Megasphaera elsdenii TaxID=907 RepID=UPI00243020B6|nr:hypothetical protein [Megasphaera elsdenii]
MITGKEARRAVNTIIEYCDNRGEGADACKTCAIGRFCEETSQQTSFIFCTEYEEDEPECHQYGVVLDHITLQVEAATSEEAINTVIRKAKNALRDMTDGSDFYAEEVYQIDEEGK